MMVHQASCIGSRGERATHCPGRDSATVASMQFGAKACKSLQTRRHQYRHPAISATPQRQTPQTFTPFALHTGNVVPRKGLRVRISCPPLL